MTSLISTHQFTLERTPLIEEAYVQAQSVLRRTHSPLGLKAAESGYPQVWARDSVITSLGITQLSDAEWVNCLCCSLKTLRGLQSPLGLIPNNVNVATGRLDHTNAGSVDSNLWYVIGYYIHHLTHPDLAFLEESFPSIQQALLWLRYQDSNECGLLEVHEAADWADLLANRFNILYDNVLWYAALRCGAQIARWVNAPAEIAGEYERLAVDVRAKISHVLWVGPETKDAQGQPYTHVEWTHTLSQVDPVLVQRPYFLPWVAFRDYGDYCDVLGNLLAILFGVASPAQERRILYYLKAVGCAEPYPIKALHPIIYPGNKDWREYYRNNNLNLPEQYHNGGIWPFMGGFYVAVLVKAGQVQEAAQELERLAQLNRLGINGEWEFTEWCHGHTGRPMGYPYQAWSAGMYIYAYHCVKAGHSPIFGPEMGW